MIEKPRRTLPFDRPGVVDAGASMNSASALASARAVSSGSGRSATHSTAMAALNPTALITQAPARLGMPRVPAIAAAGSKMLGPSTEPMVVAHTTRLS